MERKFISRAQLFALAIVFIIFFVGYLYKNSTFNTEPAVLAEMEARDWVERVGKLILLPSDEVPTIATVSDPEVLKGQPFFKDATRGDKVLIFSNAQKAFLFSPSLNLIINVASVNLGNFQKSTVAPSESGIFSPNEF